MLSSRNFLSASAGAALLSAGFSSAVAVDLVSAVEVVVSSAGLVESVVAVVESAAEMVESPGVVVVESAGAS